MSSAAPRSRAAPAGRLGGELAVEQPGHAGIAALDDASVDRRVSTSTRLPRARRRLVERLEQPPAPVGQPGVEGGRRELREHRGAVVAGRALFKRALEVGRGGAARRATPPRGRRGSAAR